MRAMLLKLAIAVAVSFTGFLYSSYNRTRRITQIPSRISSEEDCKIDDICLSEKINGCFSSPIEGNYGIGDGILLPEFVDLIKEFESSYTHSEICSIKPEVYTDDDKEEFRNLDTTLKILKDGERDTDIQLLEYYGLKEMETAFVELQNRLRVSEMENWRLVSQAASHEKTLTQLQAATEEIKFLKNKIRSCEKENREHILMLQTRLVKLKDTHHVVDDAYTELQQLKDAEDNVEELKKMNTMLQVENSDLVKRIEFSQSLPSSNFSASEMEEANGENGKLVEENERLAKEVEQLLTHRCADVEELVYLRWLNACFRYELRDYKPGSGRRTAKDLSKARSPRSEEKVKQLIFDYSKSYPTIDFDFDFDHSSSQASSSERSIRPSFSAVRTSSTRGKLFATLRSLLRTRHKSVDRFPT